MNQNKSEKVIRKLQKLYSLPSFAGIGAYTFQSKLKIEKNWSVPLAIIYKALRGIPDYVAGLKNTKVKLYRHYILNSRRDLCEFDICLLNTYGGYKGCVVLCDCFTKYLWYYNIKTKTKPEVLKALKHIISRSGTFERSLSDGELIFTHDFWKSKNTYYRALKKTQHPSFIEVAQRWISYQNRNPNNISYYTKLSNIYALKF